MELQNIKLPVEAVLWGANGNMSLIEVEGVINRVSELNPEITLDLFETFLPDDSKEMKCIKAFKKFAALVEQVRMEADISLSESFEFIMCHQMTP